MGRRSGGVETDAPCLLRLNRMEELNEVELDMIAGGNLPVINLGLAYKPTTDEPHDGGATGGC